MFTSRLTKLAAISLAASFLLPASAATAETCEQVNVLAFHIKAKAGRPAYLVGEKPVIHVTVTRPAREDPAGYEIDVDPPDEEPAAHIYVGAGVHVGDSFLVGFGVTDDEGKADIELKLHRGTDAGEADVDIYAWNDVVKSACLTVREYGYRHYEDMFRVI